MPSCFRCKQDDGTIVSRDGPKALYCDHCFLSYCSNLVRDNLFQECYLACDTPVAVAVSGGPNSMMLLRELGQLRQKTRQQLQRQQHPRKRQPDTRTPASLPRDFPILPFHLCEAELLLPPPWGHTSSSSLPPSDSAGQTRETLLHQPQQQARQGLVERARETMWQQFEALRQLVQQQPSLWVYQEEQADRNTKSKKKKAKTAKDAAADSAVPAPSPPNAEETPSSVSAPAPPIYLFEREEVRVFQYSDFLPAPYIEEVRHVLHVARLPLSDREALYNRVRQQVLCRAAQRLLDECKHQHSVNATECVSGPDGGKSATNTTAVPTAAATVVSSGEKPWCHVLVGSNAARCAVATLEGLVTGAGGEGVVHGSAFRGYLHETVWLRPLRTVLPKEAVHYTRLLGISSGYTPALRTGTSLRSIHQVVENFVHTMILSFRTMIFNVLNTVQKLAVHPASLQYLVEGLASNAETDALLSTAQAVTSPSVEAPLVAGSAHAGPKGRKAAPGRTAQQNRRDLAASVPPSVQHHPPALSERTDGGKAHQQEEMEEATANVAERACTAVQCCVCGCPSAALPAPATAAAADLLVAVPRALNVNAVRGMDTHSSTHVDAFVCYACRGLLENVFGSAPDVSVGVHSSGEGPEAAATAALCRLCALFQ